MEIKPRHDCPGDAGMTACMAPHKSRYYYSFSAFVCINVCDNEAVFMLAKMDVFQINDRSATAWYRRQQKVLHLVVGDSIARDSGLVLDCGASSSSTWPEEALPGGPWRRISRTFSKIGQHAPLEPAVALAAAWSG